MDSLETPPPPLSVSSNMTAGPTNAFTGCVSNTNNNVSSTIGHNPTMVQMMPPAASFQFNSTIAPASVPMDSLNASPFDGSHSGTFSIDSGKKKRGRPRKYSPDGNIALGLAPTTVTSSSVVQRDLSATPDSEQPAKKLRGRPPGSGKKQMNAMGSGGTGFTPHVILVQSGEDVAAKILAFSQQGPRTVCILSANGTISNATLRQPATSGGTMTYEGQFEIISLSGSFSLSEDNGTRSRTGGLSVSLAGSDGQILGGRVVGILTASTQVQVIVGSFIEEEKKTNSNIPNSGTGTPGLAHPMINFGIPTTAAATAASPPSLGGSSDSSADNGDSSLNRHPGMFNNPNPPIHTMQMYQLWAGQTQQ